MGHLATVFSIQLLTLINPYINQARIAEGVSTASEITVHRLEQILLMKCRNLLADKDSIHMLLKDWPLLYDIIVEHSLQSHYPVNKLPLGLGQRHPDTVHFDIVEGQRCPSCCNFVHTTRGVTLSVVRWLMHEGQGLSRRYAGRIRT